MNKNLISLAVAAALAAPLAVNAAPTMYGQVHLSVDSLDNGNGGGATDTTGSKLMTLGSNSSYIGIKGDEDLGEGLKAIYGAEWQMAFDASGSGLINRNVFAGFQGGFGTFRAGNYDDVVKQVGRSVDFFWNEQLGESRALTRGGNLKSIGDERLANSLNYESPKLGGAFTITVNYGMENTTVDNAGAVTNKTKATEFGLQYAAGPVYVGVGHKQQILQKTTSATQGDSSTIDRLTASYTMGNLKIGALYQSVKDEDGVVGADRTTYGIGAGFTMGKGMIKAQYYTAGDNGKAAAGAEGASLTAIGYDYNMSATTAVYAVYAAVSNKDAATVANSGNYSVIGAGHMNPQDATYTATGAGADPSGISVGMRVKF